WNTQVTETLLHQEGSVKAWEYAAGQLINGYAAGAQDTRGVAGGVRGLFGNGPIGFYFGIPGGGPHFQGLPLRAGASHPRPNGKEYNRDGPNGLSITQGSHQQDAAWQFMIFELTRGVELKMGTGFTAPTTHALARSPLWLNQLIGGENARAYDAAASQVKAIPLPPGLNEINSLVGEAFAKVVGGQASARAALLEIKPPVDAILAARGR